MPSGAQGGLFAPKKMKGKKMKDLYFFIQAAKFALPGVLRLVGTIFLGRLVAEMTIKRKKKD